MVVSGGNGDVGQSEEHSDEIADVLRGEPPQKVGARVGGPDHSGRVPVLLDLRGGRSHHQKQACC